MRPGTGVPADRPAAGPRDGRLADRIELVAPDPDWPAAFGREAARLRAVLPARLHGALHHVGSTAVPGLAAKPVIDIALVDDEPAGWPSLIGPLLGLGYLHWADNPDRSRMFFVRGLPPHGERRTHHLHVVRADRLRALLGFRDRLRAEPALATRYAALKATLAARHPDDREAYTEGKTRFVARVLAASARG